MSEPKLIVVECRSCRRAIVMLDTKAGRRMPVNVAPTDPRFRPPVAGEMYQHNVHEPHWADCPDAPKFRERKTHAPQLGPRFSRDDWPPRVA